MNFSPQLEIMEFKNYTIELLAKLLKDQISTRAKINPIRYHSFYEMLKKIIEKYNVKLLTTAEVIEQLIIIASEYKRAYESGKALGLSEEELVFYDMLLSKGAPLQYRADVQEIAKEMVSILGPYIRVADWNKKESIKAKIRATIKSSLLKKIAREEVSYEDIDSLSKEILSYAEEIYSTPG